MAVYVDDMHTTDLGRYGRMRMCHMVADTRAELLDMARHVGVDLKWLQHAGTWKEHFDVAMSKRALAVQAGAKEVPMRFTARHCRERREDATRLAAYLAGSTDDSRGPPA